VRGSDLKQERAHIVCQNWAAREDGSIAQLRSSNLLKRITSPMLLTFARTPERHHQYGDRLRSCASGAFRYMSAIACPSWLTLYLRLRCCAILFNADAEDPRPPLRSRCMGHSTTSIAGDRIEASSASDYPPSSAPSACIPMAKVDAPGEGRMPPPFNGCWK